MVSVLVDQGTLTIGAVLRDLVAPTLKQLLGVGDLVGLQAAPLVITMGTPLEMDGLRHRLVEDLVPSPPDPEAEIHILAIGRSVMLIEAAQGLEELPGDGEARARNIVRLA